MRQKRFAFIEDQGNERGDGGQLGPLAIASCCNVVPERSKRPSISRSDILLGLCLHLAKGDAKNSNIDIAKVWTNRRNTPRRD